MEKEGKLMLTRNCKFIKLLIVSIIISLVFSLAIPPKKTEANPLVIPAGIETGVGAYVLAALALSAGATLVGQPDTADRIKEHAYGVWDSTQAAMGAAWQASVQASAALAKDVKSPWVLSLYKDAYNKLKPLPDVNDLRTDFLAPATESALNAAYPYGMFGLTSYDGGQIVNHDSKTVMAWRGHLINYITWYQNTYPHYGKAVIGYTNGTEYSYFPGTGFKRTMVSDVTNIGNALEFAAMMGVTIYMLPSYTVFGDVTTDLLPKTGEDYKIKIPALDDFVPYPKTAAGSPDVTKGPLVYNPADRTYKDKTGDIVYSPDQVTWDFPKPQIINDSQTGTKTIGFINSQTGKLESVTDTGVGVPGEYEKAKEDGVPTTKHKVKVKSKEVRQLEREGEPYSSEDLVDNDDLLTRRYFGEDGMADMDIDYTNHKQPKIHPKVPHRHDFDWTKPLGENRGPWYSVITDKLPEIGENEMYKFKNFKEEISHGGESTFSYNSSDYSIVRSSMEESNGWYFAKVSDIEEPEFYSSLAELFLGVRIEDKTLEEVFDTGEVEDITIY